MPRSLAIAINALGLYGIAAILAAAFAAQTDDTTRPPAAGPFAQAAIWLVIALTAANVVSTLLECGFGACADNPVSYELLKRWL